MMCTKPGVSLTGEVGRGGGGGGRASGAGRYHVGDDGSAAHCFRLVGPGKVVNAGKSEWPVLWR
jgi:hypothetical protein